MWLFVFADGHFAQSQAMGSVFDDPLVKSLVSLTSQAHDLKFAFDAVFGFGS